MNAWRKVGGIRLASLMQQQNCLIITLLGEQILFSETFNLEILEKENNNKHIRSVDHREKALSFFLLLDSEQKAN